MSGFLPLCGREQGGPAARGGGHWLGSLAEGHAPSVCIRHRNPGGQSARGSVRRKRSRRGGGGLPGAPSPPAGHPRPHGRRTPAEGARQRRDRAVGAGGHRRVPAKPNPSLSAC